MKLQAWGFISLFSLMAMAGVAKAADFAGAGTGAIPDNNPAGLNITFSVSGFTQPIGDVRLKLGLSHTFVNDLRAILISPAGTARLVVFSRLAVRATTTAGASANFAGSYVFDDGGGDLWSVLPGLSNSDNVPAGRYRASTGGTTLLEGTVSDHGGCSTSFAAVFGGLAPADVNGTWTLNIADLASADVGTVSSALLSVYAGNDAIFRGSFDRAVLGTCKLAWLDLTGSGRTSYVLVRNTGGGPTGAVTWFVKDNNTAAGGVETNFILGIATDFFLTGDWDGDGIGDAAVWRPGSPGQFIIRPSSRPTRPITQAFGQTGDDPDHIGDYDGDRRSDFAVYRGGATTGAASHTLIKLSGGGADRDLVTGENGAFPSGGVDYTGDGIADMAIQANAGSGVASFRIFNGITGVLVDSFNFGTPTDVIITGSHSGSALADITAVRGAAGSITWTTRDTGTSVGQPSVILGASATDFPLSGDYDGDGLDDYAVWRPSATAGQSKFIVRLSTSPTTPIEIPFGQNGDYPAGNTRAH
jgi:subtilisin-like proprotein convertase family protein